ncbi:hypothetical protein M5D96_009932 [Drosophila gunungcola]|uniref:Uncharacterized protein n=1 Tax=Drosophila gunungcola TaxID=103775 RepID=A0A9P9YIF9_9MUSC|nr:hypothetical protein M5D96_009932 [Drosophila gunungcola]
MLVMLIISIVLLFVFRMHFDEASLTKLKQAFGQQTADYDAMAEFQTLYECCGINKLKDYTDASIPLPSSCFDKNETPYKDGCRSKMETLHEELLTGPRIVGWTLMVMERILITASVRTTNRMNALLSESMLSRRRAAQNPEGEPTAGEGGEPIKEKPKNDWKFFHTNFNMERALKIIEDCIEERLLHRIVCLLSIVEKQNQGVHQRMCHLMDEKRDNFTQLVFERPTYFMIVVLYLVYKD